MLTLSLIKKPKLIDFHTTKHNIEYETYCIEYILNSFENKEFIKSIVVLWKCYARFLILPYLRKRRMQGRFAESNQPDLGAFPDVGNEESALVAITVIAQCQMKNTRSDRFKP